MLNPSFTEVDRSTTLFGDASVGLGIRSDVQDTKIAPRDVPTFDGSTSRGKARVCCNRQVAFHSRGLGQLARLARHPAEVAALVRPRTHPDLRLQSSFWTR